MEKMKVGMLKCPKCGEEYQSLILVIGKSAKRLNEESKKEGWTLYYPDIDYDIDKTYYKCDKCKFITDKKPKELGGFTLVERDFPKITCPNCGLGYSMSPDNRCARSRKKGRSEEYMCPKCWTAMSKEIIEAGAKWGVVMMHSACNGGWIDHDFFIGEQFISEPYNIGYEGLKEILELCTKHGLRADISGDAKHHKDCVRITIHPIAERPNVTV